MARAGLRAQLLLAAASCVLFASGGSAARNDHINMRRGRGPGRNLAAAASAAPTPQPTPSPTTADSVLAWKRDFWGYIGSELGRGDVTAWVSLCIGVVMLAGAFALLAHERLRRYRERHPPNAGAVVETELSSTARVIELYGRVNDEDEYALM